MKKMFLIAAAILLTVTSCIEVDNESGGIYENVFVQKEVVTYTGGGGYTAIYTYEGPNLKKISYSNGTYDKATYSGDKVTRYEKFMADGTLDIDYTFEYNQTNFLVKSNRTKHFYNTPGHTFDTTTRNYTYENDGTMSFTETLLSDNGASTPQAGGTFTFNNGNLIKVLRSTINTVESMGFDARKSPYRNIAGMNELVLAGIFFGPQNNLITYSYAAAGTTASYTVNYNFDDGEYPVSAVSANASQPFTKQYFYE
jgi:hypothetical protein